MNYVFVERHAPKPAASKQMACLKDIFKTWLTQSSPTCPVISILSTDQSYPTMYKSLFHSCLQQIFFPVIRVLPLVQLF
jgi:hypothetical protein